MALEIGSLECPHGRIPAVVNLVGLGVFDVGIWVTYFISWFQTGGNGQ